LAAPLKLNFHERLFTFANRRAADHGSRGKIGSPRDAVQPL
jgi:hypothetical protein